MLNIKEVQEKYPDVYQAIFDEGENAGLKKGKDAGIKEGETAGYEKGKAEGIKEGAKAEGKRIQDVETQLIPGHEALIHDLKFDGQTTGEQAAVKILGAEKAARQTAASKLAADAIEPVGHVPAPDTEGSVANMPEGPEKWKAEYAASAEIQTEFKTVEIYAAYKQGVSEGRVKILGKEVK